MHVVDHLAKAKGPLFSFEVVPPFRGHSSSVLIDIVNSLLPFNPSWIDVTSHAPNASYREADDGKIERRVLKKRPGTIGICGIIQNRFRVDTVAHILCSGFSREETEDALIELNYLGVENVLALRGDSLNFEKKIVGKTENATSIDLIQQIKAVREGQYLSEMEDAQPLPFCIGVAGYPEKHFTSPNLDTDIEFLKKKIEAGGEYVVTQMFFSNEFYLNYVEKCRSNGISTPIVPGLKVLTSANQLTRIPRTFHCDLPNDLVNEIKASPDHAAEIGINHAVRQCQELLNAGAPGLHFYVLNDAGAVGQVLKRLAL